MFESFDQPEAAHLKEQATAAAERGALDAPASRSEPIPADELAERATHDQRWLNGQPVWEDDAAETDSVSQSEQEEWDGGLPEGAADRARRRKPLAGPRKGRR